MAHETHHRTDQFGSVPRGTKNMHPAQLHDPVDTAPSCGLGQHLFFAGIFYTQPESLQGSIELCDHFQKIIYYQHAKRATLGWIGHFRARPQKNGPIRGGGKQRAVPFIIKKPRRPGQTDRRGQCRFDLLARMLLVFLLKDLPEIFHEFTGITSGAAFEKKCLRR